MLSTLDKNISGGVEAGDYQPQCKKIQEYVYRFSDQIGMGNFSKVFKGIHQTTNKQVAIKIIQLSSLTNSRLQELLSTETKILKLISHPNVIGCQQILSSMRNCYIITQLCNGGDLEKKLKKVGHFKQKQLYQIAADIYEGLRYLAKKQIVHRDIKVSNIFINNGTYKIADFGFAQISQVQFKDISVGSPIYMSPQGYISNTYGPKTDVWAFGALLFQLIQGKTPYHDSRTQAQLKQKLLKQIDYSNFNSQVSSDLKNLIIECMEINPSLRISALDIENTPWMRKALKARNQSQKNSDKQNLINVNSHNYRKTTDNFTSKNIDHRAQPSFSNNTTTNANTIMLQQPYAKNYLEKYSLFFKGEGKDKLKARQKQKEKNQQRDSSNQKQQGSHRRKHSTLDKTIRQSKDESTDNRNRDSTKVFYSPKNAILKFEKAIGFKAGNQNNKLDLLDVKKTTNLCPSTNNNSKTSSNNTSNMNKINTSKNDSIKLMGSTNNSAKALQQNNAGNKIKSAWNDNNMNNSKEMKDNRSKQNHQNNLNLTHHNGSQKCYKDNFMYCERTKDKDKVNCSINNNNNNSFIDIKNEHKQGQKDNQRTSLMNQYKNYLGTNNNAGSSFQKYQKCNTKTSEQGNSKFRDKQKQKDIFTEFNEPKPSKTPKTAVMNLKISQKQQFQRKQHSHYARQHNNGNPPPAQNPMAIQRRMQKKSMSYSQLTKIIIRPLKFADCISIIHYCRLCYKFACLIEQSGESQHTKQFLTSWSIQLLSQLNNKIKDCQILFGNQTCLLNNPSTNPSGQSQKKKKLKDVIQQYLSKYLNSIKNTERSFISLKQASNFIYNLYLIKGHQFRQRMKDKKAYLYYALICYLSVLDKQTRNFMEFTYQIKNLLQGKLIEKLLSIKIVEFNRKTLQDITNEDTQKYNQF